MGEEGLMMNDVRIKIPYDVWKRRPGSKGLNAWLPETFPQGCKVQAQLVDNNVIIEVI